MNLSIVQELGARPTPEGLPLEGGGAEGAPSTPCKPVVLPKDAERRLRHRLCR